MIRPNAIQITSRSQVSFGRPDMSAIAERAPSGETILTVEPRKEGFFGWEPRNVELEGGYGIGGKKADASGAWYPVRLGAFHVGAKVETWMEETGGMKGAASVRIRWEPFRN